MNMYRCLLRQPLSTALSGSLLKSIRKKRIAVELKANHSSLVGISLRGQKTKVTYSRWRYWKKAVLARERLSCGGQGALTAPLSTRSLEERNSQETPESVNQVFDRYHARLESGVFQPESFSEFGVNLCLATYSDLSWLPWLHSDNIIISFMQILMNDKTKDLLREPLYSHRHFRHVYDHIDQHAGQVPPSDVPSLLLSLLYCGLDQTDPLVVKLLGQCYAAAPVLNVSQLKDLVHVLQSLGGRDFALAERIVCRLEEILGVGPQEARFEIRDLCVSNPVVAVYMSPALLERCVAAMLCKVEERGPDMDIMTIGCCFRYARKMSFRADRDNLSRIKLLGKAALDAWGDLRAFESQHVAEICHNAKRLGVYSGPVVERMQARSLALLRGQGQGSGGGGQLHVRDVTNLLFAFSRDLPEDVKREISSLLIQHLPDADVLTLSNIADNMLELGLIDPDLIALFQFKVMENIHKISQYITRLVKVLRLLRERLEYDTVFNQQVCETLLKLLDRRQGYDPTFVVVVAQFILPNVRSIVPAVLMECLGNVIPRCSLSLMLLVLSGLEKMKGPWSRSLHNQVLEIRTRVQENAGELIENATQASQLAQLVKGLHIKSQNRDFVLLDRMMEHYPRLTKTMSRHDYLKTLHVFKRMSHPYYHPEVFEDLITFAIDNRDEIHFFGVLDLVKVLGSAGYRPKNFTNFSNFVVEMLDHSMAEESYTSQITLAHHMSVMQIFPDDILGRIFTFDYLEEMDGVIQADPARSLFLKNTMMQLNRTVILECPHLDVPWFHDQYCKSLVQVSRSKDFQRNALFVDEVEAVLHEVLNGLEFMGHSVYSPYYHPIDFEIVLDKAGQPLSNSSVELHTAEEHKCQRVAVMLIANQQLCANSHRRRGNYLRDQRHLELLGYRVVEISRYDWNSMALSDWEDKVNYVRNKVFPDAPRDKATVDSKKPLVSSWSQTSAMHPYWK